MTTSELLTTVAENIPSIHEAGKKEGIEEGKKAEYDAFWDTLQDYGNEQGRNYYYAFSYNLWDDTTFNPKYPIIGQANTSTGCHSIFYANTLITDTKVPIIVKARSLHSTFYRCKNLITIREINVSPATIYAEGTFQECESLVNLKITGTIEQNNFNLCWSKKLSTESIVSVIEALSDEESLSGLSVTLSQTAVDNMVFPFTSEKTGITYNSWSELESTRDKWTITLR